MLKRPKADAPTPAALLTWAGAAGLVGVSARHLRRMVAGGHFPGPVAVPGLAGRRFRQADVQAWLATLGASQAGAE